MMKKLKPLLIWILSTVCAAIIAYIVWKYIDSWGSIHNLLIYIQGLLLILLYLTTPLWATTALVLLCCVYTYLRVEKLHSSLNQTKFHPPSKTDSSIRIDDFRESVLVFVSENPMLETNQITSSFPGSKQRALFNLQELEKIRFITSTYVSGSDMMGTEPEIYTWSIINQGLAYLNQHGLIK